MRRTTLGRRAGLTSTTGIIRRGTGLRRRALDNAPGPSARRHRDAELDVPTATRELLRARSRGRCEALIFDAGCTQAAADVHHRKRRRDGGHAITNLVDLCRPCHAWAHAHPADARRLGLIVSVYEDPATVPVLVLSHLAGTRVDVLLDELGGYVIDGTTIGVDL